MTKARERTTNSVTQASSAHSASQSPLLSHCTSKQVQHRVYLLVPFPFSPACDFVLSGSTLRSCALALALADTCFSEKMQSTHVQRQTAPPALAPAH